MRSQTWILIVVCLILLVLLAIYRKWAWEHTDDLTKWLQTVALCVAGFWAYTRYFAGEAPSLQPLANVTGQLSAGRSSIPGTCMLSYRVNIQNLGLVSLKLRL
jgi:hypothetical protein